MNCVPSRVIVLYLSYLWQYRLVFLLAIPSCIFLSFDCIHSFLLTLPNFSFSAFLRKDLRNLFWNHCFCPFPYQATVRDGIFLAGLAVLFVINYSFRDFCGVLPQITSYPTIFHDVFVFVMLFVVAGCMMEDTTSSISSSLRAWYCLTLLRLLHLL